MSSLGCATGDPGQRSVEKSMSAVSSSVQAGTRASDASPELSIRARYNPCRCDAPDYELQVRGEWHRYLLGGDEDTLSEFRQISEESKGLDIFRLRGQFSGTDVYETGVSYPYFVVDSFVMVQTSTISQEANP
jgi:hypothetical protein